MVSAQIVSGSERECHVSATPEKQQLQALVIQWEDFLPKRSLKVILVEDDDSTRHVVSALLQNCSYEGQIAYKKLKEKPDYYIGIGLVRTEENK